MPLTPAEVQSAVFNAMAEVVSYDYVSRFKPIFEDTTQLLGALPFEPGEEIRQAFDHFAAAITEATEISTDRAASAASPNVRVERALNHLQRARRHILVGVYYSLEHQLRCCLQQISDYVASLPSTESSKMTNYKFVADELDRRVRSLRTIDIEPRDDRQLSEANIALIDEAIQEITGLVNDHYRLYESVRDFSDRIL
jgi:hypothetical protein